MYFILFIVSGKPDWMFFLIPVEISISHTQHTVTLISPGFKFSSEMLFMQSRQIYNFFAGIDQRTDLENLPEGTF